MMNTTKQSYSAKYILGVTIILILTIITCSVEAVPQKGYLNSEEIRNLLDKYSGTTRRSDFEALFGKPTSTSSGTATWFFHDYNIVMNFEHNIGTDFISNVRITQQFLSSHEFNIMAKNYGHAFTSYFGKPSTHDNMLTWNIQRNNLRYVYSMSFYPDGVGQSRVPSIAFISMPQSF